MQESALEKYRGRSIKHRKVGLGQVQKSRDLVTYFPREPPPRELVLWTESRCERQRLGKPSGF